MGVFEERDDGRFALTTLGERLRTDAPGSMHSTVMLVAGTEIQDSWKDLEQAAAILSKCRAAMSHRAKLLIVEGLYPERIDGSLESRGAATNDVNMLVCTGGRQRSETEFRELFVRSGFRLARVVRTLAPVCVIEGECA